MGNATGWYGKEAVFLWEMPQVDMGNTTDYYGKYPWFEFMHYNGG